MTAQDSRSAPRRAWNGFEAWLEGIVFRLDELGIGRWLRRGLFVVLAVLPVVQGSLSAMLEGRELADHETAINIGLVVLWFVAFLVYTPLEHFKEASLRRVAEKRLEEVTAALAEVGGGFGGAMESLAEAIRSKPEGIDEETCRYLCTAILARIREYAESLQKPNKSVRLRATLAVPILDSGGIEVDRLRVWCYDRTHGDRQWTELPLNLPGAPEAYLTGEVRIIDDIRTIPQVPQGNKRTFRSVVSIPVGNGDDGRPLAVVNIDASEPYYFELPTVLAKIGPFIQPAVQAIGLALQSRRHDAAYIFRR